MGTTYAARSGVMSQELDGETVLLDADSGTYFRLNPTGTRVWSELTAGRTVEDVVAAIARDYAVDVAAVRSDVTHLLDQLCDRALVSRAG